MPRRYPTFEGWAWLTPASPSASGLTSGWQKKRREEAKPDVDVAVLREFFQAHVLLLLLKEPMISPELVEKMRPWRLTGFHAFAGDEIPDIDDAVRVGIYLQGATSSFDRKNPPRIAAC